MIAAFMVPQEPEKKPKYVDLDVAINAVFEAMADGRAIFPALNNLPAADVRPVVRGKWNNIIQGIIPSGQCSNCKAWDKVTRFCPNCGAMMEES